MQDKTPPYLFADDFVERKDLAWRVEPGEWDEANPLIEPKHPWDSASAFGSGTALIDPTDGLWKLWALSWPHDPDPGLRAPGKYRLTYAFSEDGVKWTRPALRGHPCMGEQETNVLFDLMPDGHSHYPSVFIHEDFPPERRYEMFVMRSRGALASGMYRYWSRNGIDWEREGDRLSLETSDSIFVFTDMGAPYAAYHKTSLPSFPGAHVPYDIGSGEIRVLVRRTSEDGFHWSNPPEILMTPDWRDAHDTQFMDMGPLRQGRGYVATVTVYHALSATIDIQFAGSPDGLRWWRPARRPCVANRSLGDYGGGMFWPMRKMIEADGRLYLYFCAMQGLHGDLYETRQNAYLDYGALCRVSWEKGRLWAATPAAGGPTEAHLTCRPASGVAAKTLYINAVTLPGGEISAELCTGNNWEVGSAVAGFAREDCGAFRGDAKCQRLTWKGGEVCPREGLLLRLYLRKARLYGFAWR